MQGARNYRGKRNEFELRFGGTHGAGAYTIIPVRRFRLINNSGIGTADRLYGAYLFFHVLNSRGVGIKFLQGLSLCTRVVALYFVIYFRLRVRTVAVDIGACPETLYKVVVHVYFRTGVYHILGCISYIIFTYAHMYSSAFVVVFDKLFLLTYFVFIIACRHP